MHMHDLLLFLKVYDYVVSIAMFGFILLIYTFIDNSIFKKGIISSLGEQRLQFYLLKALWMFGMSLILIVGVLKSGSVWLMVYIVLQYMDNRYYLK